MFKSREDLSPSCSSPEEMVAYLYDEADHSALNKLEEHLPECDRCTAEFAELSLARLGVFEWHREEFVVLPTPEFAIPYHAVSKVSWIDAVRAFFASPVRMASAAAAFSVLVVITGMWIASPGGNDLADGRDVGSPSQARELTQIDAPIAAPSLPSQADPSTAVGPVAADTDVPPARKAATKRKITRVSTARTQGVATRKSPATRPAASPRLNDFDDEEDNTLRLGDLLAEVDTRD